MDAETMVVSSGAIALTGRGRGLCYSAADRKGEPICPTNLGVGFNTAISPNGAWALYAVMIDPDADDSSLRVLETATGAAAAPMKIPGDDRSVPMLAIGSTGQHYAIAQGDRAKVVDRNSGGVLFEQQITMEPGDIFPQITAVALSPDATRLATIQQNHLRIFSVPDKKLVVKRDLPSEATRVTYSADGRWIAIGIEDHAIVADANDGHINREIPLAVPLQALGFDQSSRYLQTVHNVGGLFVFQQYGLDPEELKRAVCDRVPWNLSAAEWKQYIGEVRYNKTCPDRPVPNQ
jgi:hypothetical protein